MAFIPIAIFALTASTQAAPVTLARVFAKGQKYGYQIRSHITAEQRFKGLSTWIPQDLDINYNFTATVTETRPEGIVVLHYLRPTMTEIVGETFDAGPQETIQKVNVDALLTLSPVNEILEHKDLAPKTKKPTPDESALIRSRVAAQGARSFFAPYIADIHRLALFVGGVDDSLDFAPKMPLQPVKIGDTWKRTVGFQPQKLKGKDGKSAVQRLDYTYTYLGPMSSNGKQVLRIQAKLNVSTDLGEYLKQLLEDRASETNVVKVPLHFNSTIDFDLDPASRDTLHAEGQTEGGYQVFLTQTGEDAAVEEKFKGRTTMDLVGKRIVAAGKSTRK